MAKQRVSTFTSRMAAKTGIPLWCLFALSLLANPVMSDDMFLPNDFIGSKITHSPIDSKLSNAELAERANSLRDPSLNITQRALNHQWMSEYQNDKAIVGSKAFSRLFKRGFKKYWDKKRKEDFADKTYIPDSNGHGRASGDVDYDVRVSSSRINLGLTYEF